MVLPGPVTDRVVQRVAGTGFDDVAVDEIRGAVDVVVSVLTRHEWGREAADHARGTLRADQRRAGLGTVDAVHQQLVDQLEGTDGVGRSSVVAAIRVGHGVAQCTEPVLQRRDVGALIAGLEQQGDRDPLREAHRTGQERRHLRPCHLVVGAEAGPQSVAPPGDACVGHRVDVLLVDTAHREVHGRRSGQLETAREEGGHLLARDGLVGAEPLLGAAEGDLGGGQGGDRVRVDTVGVDEWLAVRGGEVQRTDQEARHLCTAE
jgi:hypothetical protein